MLVKPDGAWVPLRCNPLSHPGFLLLRLRRHCSSASLSVLHRRVSIHHPLHCSMHIHHSIRIRIRIRESIFIVSMSLVPGFFGKRSSVFDPFSLDLWNPYEGGSSPFLRDLGHFPRDDATTIAKTQIDWKETSNTHIFKADLPGLKKEEVKIEVEDGQVLKISGECKTEEEEKNDKWHRIERSQGKFLRCFRLPENAKVEEVKATMENGVLTVTIPKQPQPKSEVRAMEISG